jgi:heme/copper-type cytochrome/quinol oxidase subunit 2
MKLSRAVIVIAVIVLVLGGLFFLLRPDTPESASRNRTFDVSIEGGEMSPAEISAEEGDTVTLRVSSEEPLELHLHGYDVEWEVEPGRRTELRFEADLTGRFEIEDHETEQELGVLEVRPR